MRLFRNGEPVAPLDGEGLGRVPPGDFDVGYTEPPEDFDVYVFHLGSKRFMWEWAVRLKALGKTVLLDLDDDLHRVPSYNPGSLEPGASPDNNRRFTQRLCELADGVSCATPELARFYGRWNPNTRVLPNFLEWGMWERLEPVSWRRFRVGYMGNVDFHRADLEVLKGTVGRWVREHPDTEFVAAGDPRIHDVLGIPESQRVSTSKVWFRCMDLPDITACMDVGLAPLVRNDFNEGKSCLKGMEYNACGIPVLASPTEEYRRWVDDGVNGFLCKFPRDFVSRLDLLYADRDRLDTMRIAARSRARSASIDLNIHGWEDWFGHCDNPDRAGARVAA